MRIKIFEKSSNTKTEIVSPIINLVINDLSLFEKMEALRGSISTVKLTPNGENELLNLLFSGLNGNVYFPRKGDNSERFDAIISFSEYKSVVEIEIPSSAILDAPRNLLDDYAVLKMRKGEISNNIVPLVICWDLPNKRTDYWNVISDIRNILGLEIKTISILALAVHYWTNTPINLLNGDYYLDSFNSTMKKTIEILEKNDISFEDFPGYFSPFK